jgi:hypothetical protein
VGVDYIGWRGCALQQELGPDGFLGKLKLRAYKGAVEAQVPAERRDTIQVVVNVTGRPPRQMRYPDICSELDTFAKGIPACAACPLADGAAVGCYRYVTYPIDAVTERLLFDFFVAQLPTRDSIADQLYRDVVSQVGETSFHSERGPEGSLARLAEPLVHSWKEGRKSRRVDSAQLLAALFIPLDQLPVIVAYARFWTEFSAYVGERLGREGVQVVGDGVQLHVKPKRTTAKAIAKEATAPLTAVAEIAGSTTLKELDQIRALLQAVVPGALEHGWTVVVDG